MADSSMTYRSLGRCGTKVSTFSLGGWTTFGGSIQDQALTTSIVRAAFDAGVNFFDIADVYAHGEAERMMGVAFQDLPRHELVISSKCFWPMSEDINDRGLSRKHIMASIDRTLSRIGTDHLDIYFCHRFDEATPLEETVRAMDDLVHQGKILYWGTSEWTADQLRRAHEIADRRNLYAPQVEQPQYNLLFRERFEDEIASEVDELGMGVVVWSPLASGFLTGKYDEGIPEGSRLHRIEWLRKRLVDDPNAVRAVKAFSDVAEDVGCSRTQLALAWAAAQPSVSSVILGATSLDQLHENLGAAQVAMDEGLKARVEAAFA